MDEVVYFLVFCLVILGGLGVAELHGRYQCNTYQEITGTETKWVLLDTCYLNTEQGWQRYDEYKHRNIAHDSLE